MVNKKDGAEIDLSVDPNTLLQSQSSYSIVPIKQREPIFDQDHFNRYNKTHRNVVKNSPSKL